MSTPACPGELGRRRSQHALFHLPCYRCVKTTLSPRGWEGSFLWARALTPPRGGWGASS